MLGLKQNVTGTWRRSTVASQFGSSTEMRDRYLRMAEHCRMLAEAEELNAQARKNGD